MMMMMTIVAKSGVLAKKFLLSCAIKWSKEERGERTNDPETQPLLPPCAPRVFDRSVDLRVSLLDILMDFLALLIDLFKGRVLLDDRLVNILEELCQFDHLAFDFLNGFMAALDSAESGLGLAATVALQ